MRNVTMTSIVAAALLACGSSATAQDDWRFAVQVHGGSGIPTGEWTEGAAVANGTGRGLNAQVRVAPFASVYAGWERYSFDVEGPDDADFIGVGGHTTDSEIRLGVQATLPLYGVKRFSLSALSGLTYSQVETGGTGSAGSWSNLQSAGALGYEAGAGVAVEIVPPVSLTPAVRYRSHRAEFVDDLYGGEGETTISYWSLEIGLKFGI